MKLMVPAVAAALLAALPAAAAPGDEIYARPGRLVAASDGARLNFTCTGKGGPAVIFDSGFEDWAPAWALVQPRVAKWTRACSYDRAGTGFSTPGPMPRTSMRIAGELRSALRNAGIKGPYILVGHAFGGDNVRAFADLYPADTAGLVLVDADTGDVEPAALREEDHRAIPDVAASLGACRDLIAAGKPLPLLPHREGRPDRTCADGYFRGLPEAVWSPALNAKLREVAHRRADMIDANISEFSQLPADEDFLRQRRRFLGRTPVRMITTMHHAVHFFDPAWAPTAEEKHYQQTIAEAQARWLTLSSDSRQIFVKNSSEYVTFDAPDTVAAIIRDVWGRARARHRGR
ncbi:MAG TPA: alpha/beta hydrolase [Allosphingosinicella sp.]|nr:alpha/beta hydrolase [Allosphingosinicella sp.]